jgi:NHL repeat
MSRSELAIAAFAPTRTFRRRRGKRRQWTAADTAQPLGRGIGRVRASTNGGAARRGGRALACLLLLALAGLFTAPSAMGAFTHPFVSEFTGSDTPQGSLGNEAEKLAVRQSTGDVYVIAATLGVVDVFDASGSYLSQVATSVSGGDPDLAVDNSATASEGNLYVLPEFGPLSAFDSSGTPLYQLDGSTTPLGDFGDVCGAAVDSSGNVYVSDYGNHVIQKFDSSGAYLATISVSFSPCDVAVDTDGTIYVIQWNQSLHKLDSSGVDQGIIDSQNPKAVNVDPSSHHVYVAHDTFIREYDSAGSLVGTFGADRLATARGVDVDGTTGNVYVSSNPGSGAAKRVVIFGPLAVVPDVTTGDATNVSTMSATLNGQVDPAGGGDIVDCYFEYGTDTNYGNTAPCVPATPIVSPADVSAGIGGLTPSTIYHFRVVAGNAVGAVTGADQTFQTEGPPLVTSQAATNVTESGATLHAAVDPAGFETTCEFQYVDDAGFQASGYAGATSTPCVPANVGSVGGTFVQVSADVSGLASSTVYHFRAVAMNSQGTTEGGDRTFRTAGKPVVVSESATDVTDTTATLNAEVIPTGFSTTCEFQYVDDAAFQATGYDTATSVACSPFNLGSNFNPHSTSANATGLTPTTLYHFRVVAMNAAGTTMGDDTTFQTLESFLIFLDSFGSSGSEAGQIQFPTGMAVDQHGGKVFVADTGNARIERFSRKGRFKDAWGWGVRSGAERSEVCKGRRDCMAGIPGAGPGQFAAPTSVAVDSSKSRPRGSVYVGDAGTNVIQKFARNGVYMSTIDGSTTPLGPFGSLRGVAVDENGHLWALDGNDVAEFDAQGNFLQQWTAPFNSAFAIAVDATHDAVYLLRNNGNIERFTRAGADEKVIDDGDATALALNPETGDLYVNHGHDVVIYDHTGARLDTLLSLGEATDSQGLAFYGIRHRGRFAGRRDRLFVGDAIDNEIAIYGPRSAGPPFITAQSESGAGATSRMLKATIVPLGHKTTCTFEYVGDADFGASGYTNATTIPCTPDDLGSSYTYEHGSATATGLTIGATYHFHVVATNSAGTATGADQTFVAGPGAWTPFTRCPVDDPAMLATDGVNLLPVCVTSNSTHGSIKIGNLPAATTGNSNLQGGLTGSLDTGTFTFIAGIGGSLIADPAGVTTAGLTVTATVESAGTPTDFDLIAGIGVGDPIVTLPIKVHLVSATPGVDLGPNCYIGSDMDPIVLHPANTDVDNAMLDTVEFDADGTIHEGGAFGALVVNGLVQGDSAFSVPALSGCGPNGDGTYDAPLNIIIGLPSPSGNNNIVLEDASSALALPNGPVNGVEFSDAWHSAFD